MTVHAIGYNGAAGAGKTWVTQEVLRHNSDLGIQVSSTSDVAWQSLRRRMGLTHTTKELFKELLWDGVSGRLLLIDELARIKEAAKADTYAYLHLKRLIDCDRLNSKIVLCDCIGNLKEHEALLGLIAELPFSCSLWTIVIANTYTGRVIEDPSTRQTISPEEVATVNERTESSSLQMVANSTAALRLTESYITEILAQARDAAQN